MKRRLGHIAVSFLAVLVGLGLLGALAAGCGGSDKKAASSPPPPAASAPPPPAEPPPPPPPPPPTPKETAGQENARRSAEQYLETAAFSRAGLIRQLSSEVEGYSKADAIYAVDHIDVNWNEQAAKAAKAYLDIQPFSRAGLIQQLESSAGDGYTHAQAVYGAKAAGL